MGLEIRKITDRVWKHVPSDGNEFIFSKLYCKCVGEKFRVVEYGGSILKEYDVTDVSIYDIGGSEETFATANELMQRLEALGYIGFFYDGEVAPLSLISSDSFNAIELGSDDRLFVNQTLQAVTDAGSSTTNDITIDSTLYYCLLTSSGININNNTTLDNISISPVQISIRDDVYSSNILSRTRTQNTDFYLEDEGGSKSIATREWINTKIYDIIKLGVTTNATPSDGDVWLESNTNTGLKIRINGITKTITLT